MATGGSSFGRGFGPGLAPVVGSGVNRSSSSGHGGEDLHGWNPMKDDFEDIHFNSYRQGPGRNLPPGKHVPGRNLNHSGSLDDHVELFVGGIPSDIDRDGLKKMFNHCGNVIRSAINNPGPNSNKPAFGFVRYKTRSEAEKAISKYNGFNIGDKVLRVTFATTKEEKDRRRQQKEENDAFLKTLNCSKSEPAEPSSDAEDLELTDSEKEKRSSSVVEKPKSAFTPVATGMQETERPQQPQSSRSPSFPTPTVGKGRAAKLFSAIGLGSPQRPGSNKIPDKQPRRPGESGYESESHSNGTTHTKPAVDTPKTKEINAPSNSDKRDAVPIRTCLKCGGLGRFKCKRCKGSYCSSNCQEKDWPAHKNVCIKKRTSLEEEFEKRFEISVDVGGHGDGMAVKKSPGSRRVMLKDVERAWLPVGEQVGVILVDFQNPLDIWVIDETANNDLKRLSLSMKEVYESTENLGPNSYMPERNEVCVAQFRADMEWYRCAVEAINLNGTLRVRYLDFGNVDEISVTHIRRIMPMFLELPMQGIHCSLADIEPTRAEGLWKREELISIAQKMSLEKVFLATVISCEKGYNLLRMVDPTDNCMLSKWLIDEKLAQPKSSMSKPVSPRPSPEQQQVTSRANAVESVSSPRDVEMSPERTTVTVETPYPSIAKFLHQGKQVEVSVIEVESPSLFWIHVNSEPMFKDLVQLQCDLQQHYSKLKPKQGLKIKGHNLYAALFPHDKQWYRARVEEYGSTDCVVRYLDFGNKSVIGLKMMHSLESTFCSLPFMAVRCSLAGVKPSGEEWSREAIQLFGEQVMNKTMKATVVETDKKLEASLSIEVGSEGAKLEDIIVGAGHGVLERGSTSTRENRQVVSPKTMQPQLPKPSRVVSDDMSNVSVFMAADLKPIALPSQDSNLARVTDAPSPMHMTVQIVEPKSESLELLCELDNVLESHCDSTSPYKPKCVGELVAAKFSEDGKWYRAEVKSLTGSQAHVCYIDYGNEGQVDVHDLRSLNPSLGGFPKLGITCCLAGVSGLNQGQTFDPNLMQLFVPQMMKITGGQKDRLEVDFQDPDSEQTISEKLVRAGILKAAKPPVFLASALPKTEIPDEERIYVALSDAPDPLNVTVQIVSRSDALSEITEKLSQSYRNYESSYMPSQVGELVVGKFDEDDNWYRGEVLELKSTSAVIKFIDFGNVQALPFTRIGAIIDDLKMYTAFGVQCALAGVDETPRHYPSPCFDLNTGKHMTIVDKTDTKYIINLYENDICLNSQFRIALVSELQMPSLPAEIGLVVEISDAITPKTVTVQLLAENFVQLCKTLQEVYQGYSGSYRPVKVGELVAAQFNVDKNWYRGDVVEIKTKSAIVNFIDYGNFEEVLIDQIAKIDVSLMEYPIMGIPCSLANVGPLVKGQMWDSSHLIGQRRVNVHGKAGERFLIEVFDCDTGECINEKLISMGVLEAAVSDGTRRDPLRKAKNVESHSSPKPPSTASSRSAHCTVTHGNSPRQSSDSDHVAAHGPVRKHPGVEKLTGDEPSVFVWHVESPSLFFVSAVATADIFQNLENMGMFYPKGKGTKIKPCEGDIVATRMDGDDTWYRARVLDILSDQQLKVNFVDYGNSEIVPQSGIFRLEDEYYKFPHQAMKCSIVSVEGKAENGQWSSEAIQSFSDSVLLKACTLMVQNERNGCYLVSDVIRGEDGLSVIQMLKSEGVAVQVDENKTCSPKKQVTLMGCDVPAIKLRDGPYPQQCVMWVESPSDFGLMVLDKEGEKNLERLESLCRSCQRLKGGYKPQEGELVSACFGQTWYRGVAHDIDMEGGKVNINFIDHALKHSLSVKEIAPALEGFGEVPSMVVKCAINGLKGTEASGQWSEMARQHFIGAMSSCHSEGMSVKVYKQENDIYHIDLFDNDGKSVTQYLLSQKCALCLGAAQSPRPSTQTTPQGQNSRTHKGNSRSRHDMQETQTSTAKSSQSAVQTPSNVHPVRTKPCFTRGDLPDAPALPAEGFGVIVNVENPDHFHMMPIREDDLSASFGALSQSLQRYGNATEVDCTFIPSVDDLCIALFEGEWYRAEVTRIIGPKFQVYFIDFGNSEETSADNLRPITPDHLHMHVQVYTCGLSGVGCTGVSWSAEAVDCFKSLMYKPLHCKLIGRLEKHLVSLTSPSGENTSEGESIADMLISRHLAECPQALGGAEQAEDEASIMRQIEELKQRLAKVKKQ